MIEPIFSIDIPSTVSELVPRVIAPRFDRGGCKPSGTSRVEELPVGVLQMQATSATLPDDVQHRFGVSHLAYLNGPTIEVTCPPSPCGRLSRPRTTMGAPLPWGSHP